MPTMPPAIITPEVLSFCRGINDQVDPVYVPIAYEERAQTGECFYNVKKQVAVSGGSIAYGWQVFIWKGVYIEAEHHAVWRTSDGNLKDITPPHCNTKMTLFVEKNTDVYDFSCNRRRDNIRKALIKDRELERFLSLAKQKAELIEANSVGKEVRLTPDKARFYKQIENEMVLLNIHLIKKYLKSNDACPCGSGAKVKHCCGMKKINSIMSAYA